MVVTKDSMERDARFGTSRKLKKILLALALSGIVFSGFGWVLASPIGGSPDDDYHMGSIWCPRLIAGVCQTAVIDHKPQVSVPEPVAKAAACHAFQSEVSGSCTNEFKDEKKDYTSRYDRGDYPIGYYQFQHFFVGDDVGISVLLMRTMNLLLGGLLLIGVGLLMPQNYRIAYMVSVLVSWMPMGFYYIASINPSSWSLIGVFVYGAGLFSSLLNRGRERWLSLGLAFVGVLAAITSRSDSAFYIFVVSVAMVFAVPKDKWTRWHISFASLVSIIGIVVLKNTGHAGHFATEHATADRSFFDVFLRSIYWFFEYFGQFYGSGRGPGWFDTPVSAPIGNVALMAAGGALILGIRYWKWRPGISAFVVMGAIFGIPFVTTLKGMQPELIMYQPRYMLPLLPVFFFVLLSGRQNLEQQLSRAQVFFFVIAAIFVHALTLQATLWRYVSGTAETLPPLNLDANIQWWWNIPISPLWIWILSTSALSVGLLILAYLLTQRQVEVDELEKP